MSAHSIPNLLSLRGDRGDRGDRGRGRAARGRGRGTGATRGAASASSHDATIQGTDTDAAVSRLSAVELGYLQDPFAPFFVPSTEGPAPRRLPIINRGTYTRTSALDNLVDSFLASSDGPKQIISLGAGTDTRALRLFAEEKWHNVIYHEIDYHVVCQKKLRTVKATPLLGSTLPASSTLDETSWSSHLSNGREYHCHGVDLRQLSASPESADPASASLPALRSDTPTLLLSECCLCYLSPSQSAGILSYFTSRIPDIAVVIYEPIRPDDAFGKMMVSNLAARNISMPTVDVYRDGKDQESRLRQAGFEEVRHLTIEGIWDKWIAAEEKERLDVLEGLDEVEEWKLLAAHYIVVWASRGAARFGQLTL